MADETQQKIDEIVKTNKVVLFMKGNKLMPQCGFSMRALGIINALGVDFETVDVLADNNIREGIKVYSNWPTIPQLYIDGEFIGGSDITMELYNNGTLAKKVEGLPKGAE